MIVGTGIDHVDIRRFRQTMERQGDRFLRRVFTSHEQEYCNRRRDPVPHYAARFAAKEALFKALGTGWAQGVRWLDAELRRSEQGPPTMLLRGRAEQIAGVLGANAVHVSLSHSEETAVATVVLERR